MLYLKNVKTSFDILLYITLIAVRKYLLTFITMICGVKFSKLEVGNLSYS